MTDAVKPVRIILDDDSYCPKCGHNRDKSCVSTIDMGGGIKKCQQCDCTWSEIDGEAPKQPVADESVREAMDNFHSVLVEDAVHDYTKQVIDELRGNYRTVEAALAEREMLKAAVADYEEVLADKRRLARGLDVAMHGEQDAAKQASLCDLIEPAKKLREEARLSRLWKDCLATGANRLDFIFGESGKVGVRVRYDRAGSYCEVSGKGNTPEAALEAAIKAAGGSNAS